MLAAVVSGMLVQEQDMEIVGVSEPDRDAVQQARANAADVVILQDGAEALPTSLGALAAQPPLGFVAINDDGLDGATIRVIRDSIRFEPDDAGALAEAVRDVAARR